MMTTRDRHKHIAESIRRLGDQIKFEKNIESCYPGALDKLYDELVCEAEIVDPDDLQQWEDRSCAEQALALYNSGALLDESDDKLFIETYGGTVYDWTGTEWVERV